MNITLQMRHWSEAVQLAACINCHSRSHKAQAVKYSTTGIYDVIIKPNKTVMINAKIDIINQGGVNQ